MIDIHKEASGLEKELGCLESCCFCGKPTTWWTKDDVACCPFCALEKQEKDVPAKGEWIRISKRSMVKYERTFGEDI